MARRVAIELKVVNTKYSISQKCQSQQLATFCGRQCNVAWWSTDWAWLYNSDWQGSNQLTFILWIPVFDIFGGVLWLGCLKILVLSMPESLEAIAVKKSPKMPLYTPYTYLLEMSFKVSKMVFWGKIDEMKLIDIIKLIKWNWWNEIDKMKLIEWNW